MIPLEDVYPWLNKFGKSHIPDSSDRLVNRMRSALGEGREEKNPNEARGFLRQLKDLAYNLRDDQEVTEILIACAYSAYKLGSFDEAETILVDAISRSWSNIHCRAVVQWMLGCVLWQSMLKRQQAIVSWRNSVSDFERLARQPGLPLDQQVWYQDAWCKLDLSMQEALKELGGLSGMGQLPGKQETVLPPTSEKSPVSQLPSETTVTLASGTPSPFGPRVTLASDTLQLFTISEEIPAGDFGPSGMDPFPIGTVELNRLSIDGRPYSIHSTRGRSVIRLPLDQKMTVVKVKGDSMNLENITEQDYVLLRRMDVPLNGDIVMAEIVGIDSRATLKRYFKEGDIVTLRPNSNNPAHKPYLFRNGDDGFYIRGVVIAILKPIKMRLT